MAAKCEQPSNRDLARVFGVSDSLLSRYARAGAPIHDPASLRTWLQIHGERFGPLLQLLLDPATCRELARAIRRLRDETQFKT